MAQKQRTSLNAISALLVMSKIVNDYLMLADFGGELQNEGISLSRLLELLELSKQAYDFYVILKKLSDYFGNSEFTVIFI